MTEPEHSAGLALTPDPKYLVARLSDLPVRFSLVPGETFRTPLAWVLAEPWSAGHAAVIRRERVAGYQTSFWSPVHDRIECSATVYRSRSGAGRVFRLWNQGFRAFLAARESGRPAYVEGIGEETTAFRIVISGSKALTVAWRYRNVLASCTSLWLLSSSNVKQLVGVALAQQKRISDALG